MEGKDPLIRKLVKILSLGGVSFHDPDGYEEDLDLDWKRLRNMVQPVVDEQLAKLTTVPNWFGLAVAGQPRHTLQQRVIRQNGG
jgi:hypothetical protein